MRLAVYAGASVVLATGVFLKALHQRANFYAACVYLSQSSANLMILTNLCLLATGFILFWLQRLLYGRLRPIETEQLYERAWFAVTETCLAMTIFRGELGGWFLVMFISLLVGKVWGWIGEGRVEYLEQQPPPNPRLFHIRLALSLVLTVLFNALLLQYSINTVIHQARPDMMVMFGFEFAILVILSSSTLARYGIALVEIYITRQQIKKRMEERRAEIRASRVEAIRERARAGESSPPPSSDLPDENDVNELEIDVPGWEEKGRWVFYLDLLTDFVKLVVYLVFFAILLAFFGLPIHILRDVVVTIRSFARRIMDFLRFRNATRDMNERYPDATAEEVAREEVCIICREEMVSAQPAPDAGGEADQQAPRRTQRVPDRLRPKKLPCGHILHFACLRSWLERQQNCPTCRRPVLGIAGAAVAAGVNANAPGNGAGIQPNNVGANQMPGQPGAQGNDIPRPRVYQFGPFRVGFGAVRGDLFQNLHQQIHQPNAPMQPAPDANPQGARQIGFGFGFGRRPPVQAPTPTATFQNQPGTASNFADINTQLQQVEQRIAQEINSLRIATEQLRHVRHLQMELDRLRQQQANPPVQTPTSSVPTTMPPSTSTITSRRQFVSSPGATPLASGDSRLPEGLSIPPGWTLLPLHSTEQGLGGVPQELRSPPTVPGSSLSTQIPTTTVNSGDSSVSNPTPPSNSQSEEVEAPTHSTASAMDSSTPNWTTSADAPAGDQRAESPSQEWTDVQSEQVPESSPGLIPSTWGSNGQASKPVSDSDNTNADSQSKGKGRAATVEEAADEETT
ncbi:hypothetical protein N7462_011521 [Penicillium macrosclerotiorum]|uniref:uncharacterized protein n=1 Tax=Penicillium macrosclerotiorum TaxID=303699 RepID=UPI002549A75B|nr:uncharacterized protein N7462_011521 [Penicillium macrosclerotiorum]KAJ5664708.1 hypothetical protein N7462_011521 [Penicillium macrosclerotiorum]